MIKEAISKLVNRQDLTAAEAAGAMAAIMDGEATPAQIGAFVTALRMKGETVAEIAGLAGVMRDRATNVPHDGPLLDTCGTGGDNTGSFNVSTTAAFVVAGAGATVAKHGNRAMSSACGSADVLEALGVKLELGPDGVARCLREAGIGFMFAPLFHPSMKHAGPARREVGIRTVFNILGPLTNPAKAEAQLLGVADARVARQMAEVLAMLGSRHALVVHGAGGLDEISISGPTTVYEVRAGQEVREYTIQPEDYGIAAAPLEAIKGGNAAENAATLLHILRGEETGPQRDIVLLNAAAALVAADLAGDIAAGLQLAKQSLDSGAAADRLERMVAASHA